jgi:CRP/FNR family transcriptional regulator, cyclic AMP receptor protein
MGNTTAGQQGAFEGRDPDDSMMFSTAFAGLGLDPSYLVPWEARAVEVDARRTNAAQGARLLQEVWAADKYMRQISAQSTGALARYFDFARVEDGRDIIRQDEYGNFMVVVLTGTVAVDRIQPWGERLRLAETKAGEILGEMSLLDSGIRFSTCTTITPCDVAVLGADGLDQMMGEEPRLAASLVALLARKLSLRLRLVSARLSENPGKNAK